ncbi:MAG: GNAT family N-acetyltransferase [Oscillospiraceae bacterium]
MKTTFRTYRHQWPLAGDYDIIRNFLIERDSSNYAFGRWDWMATHSYLEEEGLSRIGMWERDGEMVALATYDTGLGKAYLLTLPGAEDLYPEMLDYAAKNLGKDGEFAVLVPDRDEALQEAATAAGYRATDDREFDAVYPIDDLSKITYSLPEGFSVVSMEEELDFYKYGQVLWKGFNHEANGEGPFQFPSEHQPVYEREWNRPNLNRSIKIAVKAPNGDFVSYCGMWQDAASPSALVEPVATDPAYRKMGLGKAAVLEGVRRCGALGAKRAFVGSSQLFYYSIGFRPYAVSTFWAKP